MNDVFPSVPGLDFLSKLGEGGMSTVWKAIDANLKKIVAVKVLNNDLASNQEDVDLFAAEEKAMEEIDHKGIVKSYELIHYGNLWCYVMEYVDGYNFSSLLNRKQHLGESDCLLICESVAVALDYAWNEHGVVHCDIKPDNIMINTDGEVKLTDLGLCHTFKYLKDGLQEVPDHVLGTPAYISPEQVYGDREADCRSDIYSLAASIYHLATGRVLFPGLDNEAMLRAHCDESMQAKDPREYRPGLSEGFCQLLESMLVKDRDKRVSSWNDVLTMCLEIEQGVSFKPRTTGGASSMHLMSDSNSPSAMDMPTLAAPETFVETDASSEDTNVAAEPMSGAKIIHTHRAAPKSAFAKALAAKMEKRNKKKSFKVHIPHEW